jgi:hypothetical protein
VVEVTIQQAVEIIELDISYCANTYGSAPCTAAVGVTGDRKCTNCLADCQDSINFVEETVTLRFAKPADYLVETGIDVVAPTIQSIDFSPAIIEPGETLGTRASIRITFRDHPHSDTGPGFDKYWDERSYNPYEQGSFWGRFRARQPYLKGEALRWKLGFVGDDFADYETRHFIVESFDGPTPDGTFTIVAKDPLKLLDGDRAQAPRVSRGKLANALTESATSTSLEPVGIGNAEYATSGKVQFGGKEVVSFTRAGNALTITRAQYNTTVVAHEDEERVQQCLEYISEDPADIIYDLMVNFGGIDPAWIDLPTWQTETATYFGRNFTGLVAEPTPVKQLIDEVIEQAGLAIWWDDLFQTIRLQVLRQITTSAFLFTDSHVVKGSLKVTEQPGKRVSQCWCRFGQTNPLRPLEEEANFRTWEIGIDSANEEKYGQAAVATIWSRWIPIGGRTTATRANDLKIGRYTNPPRKFAFSLFRGSVDAPQLGGGYRLEARTLQDATGAREQVPIQITSVRPTATGWDVEAIEMRYTSRDSDDLTQHPITIDVDQNNLNARTVHDSLYADAVAGTTVSITVETNVVIGSALTSLPAFDVGDWPSVAATGNRTNGNPTISSLSVNPETLGFTAGMFVRGTGIPDGAKILSVTSNSITLDQNATSTGTGGSLTVYTVIINLIVKGRIQGAGGKGGKGANAVTDTHGQPGLVGGDALYTRYPINLILDDGVARVWSGGGGGGGSGCRNPNDHGGGGGGGGAGQVPGIGGALGSSQAEAGDPGTLDAGGRGGRAYTSDNFFALPGYSNNRRGGTGGAPGQAGATGQFNSDLNPGSGGAAGKAIDGVSFCKKQGTGDIRGSQVN